MIYHLDSRETRLEEEPVEHSTLYRPQLNDLDEKKKNLKSVIMPTLSSVNISFN